MASEELEVYDYRLWVKRFCRDKGLNDIAKEQMLAMFEAHAESYENLLVKSRISEVNFISSFNPTTHKEFKQVIEARIKTLKSGVDKP